MKSDKAHSMKMIGLGFIILAAVIASIGLTRPRVYEKPKTETAPSFAVIASSTAVSQTHRAESTRTVTYPLNINTCSLEELMTIDGLGEKKASAIIEYRNFLEGYTSVEQIMEIKGFSKETYEAVAGYLTV